MAMVDTVYWLPIYRRTCGPSRLAWSKGRRLPGAVSVFIAWTEWTLAMTLLHSHDDCTINIILIWWWLLLLLLLRRRQIWRACSGGSSRVPYI